MKLSHYDIETVFSIEPQTPNVLIIEDERLFYRYCNDLYQQISGNAGEFCLSNDGEIVKLSKTATIIFDYFTMQNNDKKVLQKFYQSLQHIVDDKLYFEFENLLRQFSSFFDKLNAESEFPIEYDDAEALLGILKAFDVKFEEEDSFLPLLISNVRILSEFSKIKCFFFVNLKTFLNDEQLKSFYHEMQLDEISVFLLENNAKPKLPCETVVIIDRDLCEIIE